MDLGTLSLHETGVSAWGLIGAPCTRRGALLELASHPDGTHARIPVRDSCTLRSLWSAQSVWLATEPVRRLARYPADVSTVLVASRLSRAARLASHR